MKHLTKRQLALKARVLAYSSTVSKNDGMAALTVDTVMGGINRTGSGFYSVFSSKAQLLRELVENELELSVERFSGPKRPMEPFEEWMQKIHLAPVQDAVDDWIEKVLHQYLSMQHVSSPAEGCALPALSTDIARLDAVARIGYEDTLEKIVEHCSRRIGCAEAVSWAVVVQCIGAVIVARAIGSEKGQSLVLESSKDFIRAALKKDRDNTQKSIPPAKIFD